MEPKVCVKCDLCGTVKQRQEAVIRKICVVLAAIAVTACGVSDIAEDSEASDASSFSVTATAEPVSTVIESDDDYFDEAYERSLLPYEITYETAALAENGITAAEIESLVQKSLQFWSLVLWDTWAICDEEDFTDDYYDTRYYHVIEPSLSSPEDLENMVYGIYTGEAAVDAFDRCPVRVFGGRLYAPSGGMSGQSYKKEYGILVSNDNECVARFCDSFGEWETDFTFVRTDNGWRISKTYSA
ncbi:hypothetical protein FACS189499_08290 [Clostridia bacterium]|nr:hypothetical protein FACS189499_08290 [Clostridia bacterium]